MQIVRKTGFGCMMMAASVFFWSDSRLLAADQRAPQPLPLSTIDLLAPTTPLAAEITADAYWDQVAALYQSSFGYDRLTDHQRGIWAYLFKSLKPTETVTNARYTYNVLKDLSVLCGVEPTKSNSLVRQLDRTQTLFGHIALRYQLAKFTADSAVIMQRQKIIQELVDNPELFKQCEEDLNAIKKVQMDVIRLLAHNDQMLAKDPFSMTHMEDWRVEKDDSIFARYFKKGYNLIAHSKKAVAERVNNVDTPYINHYGLEGLIWWEKFQGLRPIVINILTASLVYAWLEKNSLTAEKDNNQALYNKLLLKSGARQLSSDEYREYGKWWFGSSMVTDQNSLIQTLSTDVAKLQASTKVGIGPNSIISESSLALMRQAEQNASNASAKLSNLRFYPIRAMTHIAGAFNYFFNPGHPSKMNIFGYDVKSAESGKLWGYGTKLYNFAVMGTAVIGLLKNVKDIAQEQVVFIEQLRKELNAFRAFDANRAVLYATLHDHGTILPMLSSDTAHALAGNQVSHKLQILLSYCRDNVFANKVELTTFGTSKILGGYKLFQQVKGELVGMLRAIGEIDLYLSLARLYKERQATNTPFSFVELSSDKRAFMEVTDVWNPFIKPHDAVTNNVAIGMPGSYQHMLLTGSNTGGKSTLLRALCIAAFMGQTLGIAPAAHLAMTPFDQIMVLLNVSDNIAMGESTYAAEWSRSRDLLQHINGLGEHERLLVVIDELFKGTHHEAALASASAVTHYIARTPKQVVTFFATHFKELTRLEEVTQGRFKNYRMDADHATRGGYSCAYKLQEGPSEVSVASDIMRQKMDGFDLGDVEADLAHLLAS